MALSLLQKVSTLLPPSESSNLFEQSKVLKDLNIDLKNDNNIKNNEKNNKIEPIKLLFNKLQMAIRAKIIDNRHDMIPGDKMFNEIANDLHGMPKMTYDQFVSIRNRIPNIAQKYFTAKIFFQFVPDENFSIDTEDFLRYLQRSIDVESTILNLHSYASSNSDSGLITESELEYFILETTPKIPALRHMHDTFRPFYVFLASRRFFFFLDQRRTRQISIKRVGTSSVMEELLLLQRISQYQEDQVSPSMDIADQIESNWFSANNALRVYRLYLDLDEDRNGMLNQEELINFRGGNDGVQLTKAAVSRIFEEDLVYQATPDSAPEMDYKAFLDLVLAFEHRDSPESFAYFWRLLDMDHTGELTIIAITHFYRSVSQVLKQSGYDVPSEEDVIREIYDMVGIPQNQPITLKILEKSGQGAVIAAMLLDVNGFWQYDNRESLLQSSNDDDDNF